MNDAILIPAADVREGDTVTFPKAPHLAYEVEEVEGCRAGDAPGVRLRSGGLSTVYAETARVWVLR